MAITYIDFVPSALNAPQFQLTLDEDVCTAIITWNLFAQRYYLNLYRPNGDLLVCKALIGSPIGQPIETLTWKNGIVSVVARRSHGLRFGSTVNLTISGVVPAAYNGVVEAFITGPMSFTFALDADPGAMTTAGTVDQNIDLVAGYVSVTTLVYRTANRRFEVTNP